MNLLAPRTLLASLAVTLIGTAIALPASASNGPGGTITFQGALVEPTCLTEVQEHMLRPDVVSVRLLECRQSPTAAKVHVVGHVPAAQSATPAAHALSGRVEPVSLSAPVAELAGRAVVETLTLSYQ